MPRSEARLLVRSGMRRVGFESSTGMSRDEERDALVGVSEVCRDDEGESAEDMAAAVERQGGSAGEFP